jgi:anaerobic magnesium-protoporphyrin IX monomethyl ester cyclase
MPQNIRQSIRPLRVALFTLNSQYIHSALAPWCLKEGLSAYAQTPHESLVVEGTVNEPEEEVLERLFAAAPDVLGISCYIWNIRALARLLHPIRATLPDCVVVLGGPEVGHRAADALMQYPEADFILAGEGEVPFACLIDALCGLMPLETVPGLCCRLEGQLLVHEAYVHDGLALSPYSPAYFEQLQGRIAYLETSRPRGNPAIPAASSGIQRYCPPGERRGDDSQICRPHLQREPEEGIGNPPFHIGRIRKGNPGRRHLPF